jgi:hypothetical protein
MYDRRRWSSRGSHQAPRLLGEHGRNRIGCTPGNLCAELANDAQKNRAEGVSAETKTAPVREPSEKLVAVAESKHGHADFKTQRMFMQISTLGTPTSTNITSDLADNAWQ